jgi:hypothetical protein
MPPPGFATQQKKSNFKHAVYRDLGETHPKPHTVAHYAGHYQNYPFPRQGKAVEHTLFAIAYIG